MSVLKAGWKLKILVPAAIFAVLSVSGCASVRELKPRGGGEEAAETAKNAWWYASFQIHWPRDQEPSLNTDLLIAHMIISPVLDRYRQDLVLWRFHRRAAPDEAGHRFSFIFYTSAANARRIYAAIDSSPVLDRLKAGGVIEKVSFDDTGAPKRLGVESVSDGHWSFPLQKAWPYFIMGASQTWLDLIDQYAGEEGKKAASTAELQAVYDRVGKEVEGTWQREGAHAFLHHLNALFGYGPIFLRNKTEMRF
jgi:uncharacterized protein YceK